MKIGNKKILKYDDLKNIIAGENNERLVILNKAVPEIVCAYKKIDMVKYVGQNILVREKVAFKLKKVNNQLKKIMPGAKLKVVYGYRRPLIQKKYFNDILKELRNKYPEKNEKALIALAHNFVAVPDVAGHPVGGAIDLTIELNSREIDMGTEIAEFSRPDKIKTFSARLNKAQANNRLLLCDLMLDQGFAPFYGEWWHFSYGDKEWACFYGRKRSLYSSKNIKI